MAVETPGEDAEVFSIMLEIRRVGDRESLLWFSQELSYISYSHCNLL